MSRFIISGGGTGGHIYPAIAIAQEIIRREPEAEILFIGALGKLEMEKVPAAGFHIEGLPVAGFIRRMTLKNISFPFKLLKSMWLAKKIIRKFKPDVVIGVGGYASGPALRVATSSGTPTLIQEQNSFPGVTNRFLGERVDRICVAYPDMERYFPAAKTVITGNPVRADLVDLNDHDPKAYPYFGLDPVKKTLLILGGSGGAKTINESILALLKQDLPGDVQLLWQTGKYYYEEVKGELSDAGCQMPDKRYLPSDTGHPTSGIRHPVSLQPFIDRMDYAYSCADLVVSRAGAIAISELCMLGKPVILIPSPNVAEDHQTKNARALADQQAAILIPDKEAAVILPEKVRDLMYNGAARESLSRQIKKLAVPDSAGRIANEVFSLVNSKTSRHE